MGPGHAGFDRAGGDIGNFALPAATPAMCQQRCADNAACRAWTYVNPGVQGPQAHCWLKGSMPLEAANACCTSGIKVDMHPASIVSVQGATDRAGSDYANFDLPTTAWGVLDFRSADFRLCQGECAASGVCRAFSYVEPNGGTAGTLLVKERLARARPEWVLCGRVEIAGMCAGDRQDVCCYDAKRCLATGFLRFWRLAWCAPLRYPLPIRIAIFQVNGRWTEAAAGFKDSTQGLSPRSPSCNRKRPYTLPPTRAMRWTAARPSTGSATRTHNSAVKWEGSALLINTLVSGPHNYTVMDRWKLSPDHATLTITRQVIQGMQQSEGVLVYRGEGWRAPADPPPAASGLPGSIVERGGGASNCGSIRSLSLRRPRRSPR